jgi:ABC-type multidrug transport system fused ATPase/permease subunit
MEKGFGITNLLKPIIGPKLRQRWDEMIVAIKVDKEELEKIALQPHLLVVHVKSSITMQKLAKKAKKEKTIEELNEKIIDNLVFQKTLKSFNATKFKFVNEKIMGEYGDYFPLINKLIVGVKILVNRFYFAPKHIVYHPL